MAAPEARKRGTIIAGVALGALALIALLVHLARRPPDDGAGGGNAAPKSHARGIADWMPWSFFDGGAKLPDPYKGERVPVTVTVLDVDGRVVEGADVEARGDADQYEVAGLSDEQYESYLKDKAAADGRSPQEEGSADWGDEGSKPRVAVEHGRTGRDGTVVLKMKPDVSIVFYAHDDHGREGLSAMVYVPPIGGDGDVVATDDAAPKSAPAKPEPVAVTIEIADLGSLAGSVVDPRGRPIAGAEIRLASWSSSDVEADQLVVQAPNGANDTGVAGLSDADGKFSVRLRASGAFDLEVHAAKFQPVVQQAVQVLPGRRTDVTITMQPSAEISGKVVDPTGAPVPDARVVVQRSATDSTSARANEPPGQTNGLSSFETSTDDQGAFDAPELAPGTYTVAASAEGFRPAESWDVQAGGAPITLRLTTGGSIHGTLTVSQDLLKTIPNANGGVDGVALPKPPPPPPPDAARTGDDDDAAPDEADANPGWFGDVYVAVAGDPDASIPVATGVPRDRIAESPSGTLDGHGRYFTEVEVDPSGQGEFDVTGLPGGTYVLTVMLGTATTTLGSVRVFDSGTVNVSMRLPDRDAASISGVVRGTEGRTVVDGSVFAYGPSLPSGLSAALDPAGHFEFSSVPPGSYMIHAVVTLAPVDAQGATEGGYANAREVTVSPGQRSELDIDVTPGREPDLTDVDGAAVPGGGGASQGDGWGPSTGDDVSDDAGGNAAMPTPDDTKDQWGPDLMVEELDTGLVVTSASPSPNGGPRLFGGDRVVSIDGTQVGAMEGWQAMELLYGPKDSICTVTANRPATGETISVSMPRTKPAEDAGDGGE